MFAGADPRDATAAVPTTAGTNARPVARVSRSSAPSGREPFEPADAVAHRYSDGTTTRSPTEMPVRFVYPYGSSRTYFPRPG